MHADHFINNQWVRGTGQGFSSRNPATQEVVWQGYSAEEKEVNDAVKAASRAQEKWALLSIDQRIKYLEKYREALSLISDKLAEAISQETGKPLWESEGEVIAMSNKVEISIEAYHARCPTMSKPHPAGLSITRHKPHGVIGVLGPFNFPGHLPNGHIVPALLAGNTVIFKPSEYTPKSGQMMMQAWEKCDLPPGVINMILGARDTGRILVNHSRLDGLFFTGNWETGVIFSEQFAKHPEKILALEMGGNNPLVVSKVANARAAALVTIQSAYLTAGQRCSCARRLILIENKESHQFLTELERMIDNIQVGAYTDVPEPFMGPVISERTAQYLITAQNTIRSKGGKPIREMGLLKENSALLSPGLMDITDAANLPDEEIFGPFLQLIRVRNLDEAIDEANNTAFGLTAGLLSTSQEEFNKFYCRIRAGVINWNAPLTGASSSAPFGGIKRSGNYRPSAYYAADYCAYPVASIESPELKMSKLPQGIKNF
jgi:succinylglutamic semialdehyde dehydrogenase